MLARGSSGVVWGQRCELTGVGRGGTRRGLSRGPAPCRQPGTRQSLALGGRSGAPSGASRPTHLATASTEPAMAVPPPAPLSYSTPEMSSSTPRTPASRSPHGAMAPGRAPPLRVPTGAGTAAQGRLGTVVPRAGQGGKTGRKPGTGAGPGHSGVARPRNGIPFRKFSSQEISGQRAGKAENKSLDSQKGCSCFTERMRNSLRCYSFSPVQ